MPDPGSTAPDFTLTSDAGEQISLSSFRGVPVVLYFYPRDDTPGCTVQACGIRDAWGQFERAGAVVLGVSTDSAESHAAFRKKYDLPFTLLADTEHAVADAYGVWGEKSVRRPDLPGHRAVDLRDRRRRARDRRDARRRSHSARGRRSRGPRGVTGQTPRPTHAEADPGLCRACG